jgi:myosin heavy subunit
MRRLRASGFGNEDISRLAGSRWSTNAVKKATAGTPVTAPEDQRQVMTVLQEVITNNIPLPDLQSATTIHHQIGSQLPILLELLAELAARKMTPKEFLDDYGKMKAQQLTPQTLHQALQYRDDLEKAGLNLAALSQVKAVAEKHGDFAKVMVALDAYGTLAEIQKEAAVKKKELDDTQQLLETAKEQLKNHQQLEEASKALLKSYQDLQSKLTDAITKMPADLATSLGNVTADFKNKTQEHLNKLSETISNAATKELQDVTTNLNTLKEQFKSSQKELADTIESSAKASIESVESIVTKASETVTQMENAYKGKLDTFQKQTTTQLEGITTQLATMKENFEAGQKKLEQTVTTGVAESTKKVDELATHAVEVGKKLALMETQYNQSQPYIELSYLSDARYFNSISPRVVSTVRVVVRGFLQWVKTSPGSVTYPSVLASSGDAFLQRLNDEVPNV